MTDEKTQRRLLQSAQAQQKKSSQQEHKQRRGARGPQQDAPSTPRLHCPKCLALYDKTVCPNCDLKQENYMRFCRNCLRVHAHLATCQKWRPSVVELIAEE